MNLVKTFNTLKEAGEFIGVSFQIISNTILRSKTHRCKDYYLFREEQNGQNRNSEGNS